MDDIHIEPVYGPGDGLVSLYASHQGRRAGYARLSIAGDHAELIDVNVYHRKGHWSWWPPFYYRGVNYRERGIGDRLLERVIEICQAQGVRRLAGEMHGDVGRLSRWYRRHGLGIGPGNTILYTFGETT